jgi:MSHA biogenesis protein MshK
VTRTGSAFSALLLIAAMAQGAVAAGPGGLIDPTRPLVAAVKADAAAPQDARPALESLLVGSDRRVAVIDGQRMHEGEERGGLKVWEIRSDGVVVSVNGAERMLLSFTNPGMHKELR